MKFQGRRKASSFQNGEASCFVSLALSHIMLTELALGVSSDQYIDFKAAEYVLYNGALYSKDCVCMFTEALSPITKTPSRFWISAAVLL